MCLNGFLPVVSYAFKAENDFYPIVDYSVTINIFTSDGNVYNETGHIDLENNSYKYSNGAMDNVYKIEFWNNQQTTIPYNFDVYDYYIVGMVYSYTYDLNSFTFKPRNINAAGVNVDTGGYTWYDNYNLKIYNIDTYNRLGFGFSFKVDLSKANNAGINTVEMLNDKDLVGKVPATLRYELGVMAVEKTSSEDAVLASILNKLDIMEDRIVDTIETQTDKVTDSIENQYEVQENEDFGVTDIVGQVNEKAGVLSFGTDTLVNFLDLFDAANATNTKLTFPGFSMKVQGVDYQVWPDYHYDLSELENQFGALIEVVRWGCVMCVWLAVLNYLVKAYDTIFGR